VRARVRVRVRVGVGVRVGVTMRVGVGVGVGVGLRAWQLEEAAAARRVLRELLDIDVRVAGALPDGAVHRVDALVRGHGEPDELGGARARARVRVRVRVRARVTVRV
jgi:hypothetical protein